MCTKIKKGFFRIYTALLCLSIAVAGICLIAQCLLLYRSGDQPYSAESVANAFSPIALPVYFCGAMVLLGFFLKPLLPSSTKKPEKNYPLILLRLRQTTNLDACPPPLKESIQTLHRRQRVIRLWSGLLLTAGGVVFLCYSANPEHFHPAEINRSMITAMHWLLPCMAIPFGFGIFAAYREKRDIQQEIELLKSAPPEAKKAASPTADTPPSVTWVRWSILAVAVLLIGLGYFLGGTVDVLTKAVNICTECIGLG